MNSERRNYYLKNNISWLILRFVVITLVTSISFLSVFLVGATRYDNFWVSQGANRLNNRYMEISSVHYKNVFLSKPTYKKDWKNSTTSNPLMWNDNVCFNSWDGFIGCFDEKTGDLIWEKNICKDYYNLNDQDCQANISMRKYISVVTPSIWKSRLVIFVKFPADILVVRTDNGNFISKGILSKEPYVELLQSGSVRGDSVYVGTGLSEYHEEEQKETCEFDGKFYRWDLKNQKPYWVINLNDPLGNNDNLYTVHHGLQVRGSSPAIFPSYGLVSITVGSPICWSHRKKKCYLKCENLPYEENDYKENDQKNYKKRYPHKEHESDDDNDCEKYDLNDMSLHNSVVVIRMEDGSIFWTERIQGDKYWKLACYESDIYLNCDSDECIRLRKKMMNCPDQHTFKCKYLDFPDSPVLVERGKNNHIVVTTHSGLIVSFDLLFQRKDKNPFIPTYDRINWVSWIHPPGESGGLSVAEDVIYFSYRNKYSKTWYLNKQDETYCGGWGSISNLDGSINWMIPDFVCKDFFDECKNVFVSKRSGSISPPSSTNNIVLVTSYHGLNYYKDTHPNIYNNDENLCSGYIYAISSKNGDLIEYHKTGQPFSRQGCSIRNKCIYSGGGSDPKYHGGFYKFILGWCVNTTHDVIR